MNILIYTITRNSSKFIQNYYDQVNKLPALFPEHNFYLSLYENDSEDNTCELINSYDFSRFKDYYFNSEKLDAKFYNSVKDADRVNKLAQCRNKALFDCNFLQHCDYALMIESDCYYHPDAVRKLLNFNHKYNLDADIVSSVYLWSLSERILYDTWGTRIDDTSTESFLKPDWNSRDYDSYYATSNGICLFKAEPFKLGAKYDGYNDRLKKYDCDTIVVCENFIKQGYNKIYINYKSKVYTSWT